MAIIISARARADRVDSTSAVPPDALSNQVDDLIYAWVAAADSSPGTFTNPSGWTEEEQALNDDNRSILIWKRVTSANETWPTLTMSKSMTYCYSIGVLRDIDWVAGAIRSKSSVQTDNGNTGVMPTINTTANNSLALFFYSKERREPLEPSEYTRGSQKIVTDSNAYTGQSTASTDMGVAVYQDYDMISGTTVGGLSVFTGTGSNGIRVTVEFSGLTRIPPHTPKIPIVEVASTSQTDVSWRDVIGADFSLIVPDDQSAVPGGTLTFGTSDISGNQITINSHGCTAGRVVRFDLNGQTAAPSLTDGQHYYLKVIDDDTLELSDVVDDVDTDGEWYQNNGSLRSSVTIAGGTGTAFQLHDSGIINSVAGTETTDRPPEGNDALDPFNGGTSGAEVNWFGFARTWSSTQDFTGKKIQQDLFSNAAEQFVGRTIRGYMDDNDNWFFCEVYNRDKSGIDYPREQSNAIDSIIDVGDFSNLDTISSYGTFDPSITKREIILYQQYVPEGDNGQQGPVVRIADSFEIQTVEVVGGDSVQAASWIDIYETMVRIDPGCAGNTIPSQFSFQYPFSIGDGTRDVIFDDSNKSVGFRSTADGVTRFTRHVKTYDIDVNLTASSDVNSQSMQYSASEPYRFTVTMATGAVANLFNTTFIFGSPILDADFDAESISVIGGSGVTDNDSQIRNSTFIINDQLGADNGMLTLDSSTDNQGASFSIESGVTNGHAWIITTPGVYSLTNESYSGFGGTPGSNLVASSGSNTAVIYNNSGGAVTINVSGGDTPSVRNGAGATTTVSASVPVTVTVTTDGSTPIENARVYLREAGGGSVILNGLSNASGVVSGSFSGGTPQNVEGWVRKSSSSPYYKTFNLGGSITSSGFAATAIMALDE